VKRNVDFGLKTVMAGEIAERAKRMRTRFEITPLEFTTGLIFGGLVILMFVLGGKPVPTTVLFVVAPAEFFAFAMLRNLSPDASGARRTLRAAALLTILAAALFLVPMLLTGHVKSCFECENETREGQNYFGLFVLMWLAGAAAGIGALISWGISLVRLDGGTAPGLDG
jgi:hypothetical protein